MNEGKERRKKDRLEMGSHFAQSCAKFLCNKIHRRVEAPGSQRRIIVLAVSLKSVQPPTWHPQSPRTQVVNGAKKSAQSQKLSTETKSKKIVHLVIITVMEIAQLVMEPPSDHHTTTSSQLPASPRRTNLPSPLAITVSSEYSRSITMAETAHPSTTTPSHSWPNCYPSPPTEDQTNEQKIISEILLNSPTSSTGATDDPPLRPHGEESRLVSPDAADTSAVFLYPQIGKPTSSKCERFMEFMRTQKRRRMRPRIVLDVRAGVQETQLRRAGYGVGAATGVPLPYLRSPPRQRTERGFFVSDPE
ncbi:hypothetical protein BC830DRAFT_1221270 [Chytriomyces sp. MP71]|nr:hypothetical protein BC830DRAFT_1221270 [Chytriomyces sp. MP71]